MGGRPSFFSFVFFLIPISLFLGHVLLVIDGERFLGIKGWRWDNEGVMYTGWILFFFHFDVPGEGKVSFVISRDV